MADAPPSTNSTDNATPPSGEGAAGDDGDDSLTLHLTVTGQPGAPRVPLRLPRTATAAELRRRASEATSIPPEGLRLIFRGRLIGSDDTQVAVAEYKLEEGSVLHCMGKPATIQGSTGTAAASGAAATSAGRSPAPSLSPASTTAPLFATSAPPARSAPAAAAVPNAADPLQSALQALRASVASPATYQTAVSTLDKILSNIVEHPLEEKYRQLKVQNPAFQRRLGGLPGGDALMLAAGFVRQDVNGDECYVMQASPEAWPQLMATKAAVAAVVRQQQAAATSSSVPASRNPLLAALGGGGVGPGGLGLPGGGSLPPGMESAVADVMSDPQALQAMFQNPMVQAMMRSDPRLANNPAMRQVMDEVANNPRAAEQLSQLMRDPAVRGYLQSAMAQGQQGGGGGGFFPPVFPPPPAGGGPGGPAGSTPQRPPPQQQQQQQQPPSGTSDEEMTEEEMIAEAIRRSLQDG